MSRTGVLRLAAGVAALGAVAVGVLLLSPWWDRHRLNARLDSAPVPAGWQSGKTVQGSGDAPLGDDIRPWVVRQYRVDQPMAVVTAQASAFLSRWGCQTQLRSEEAASADLQASCHAADVTIQVDKKFVYTASGFRSVKTTAPPGGAAVSLWLGHQGP